jgi:hypothetical protein
VECSSSDKAKAAPAMRVILEVVALPSQLIVASKQAALYQSQDGESPIIAPLSEGETLIPLIQTKGGNDWYMVKTQRGFIGWIKALDVRVPISKKR